MKQLYFLDLIRGCAAILVVMGHLRSLLFDNWSGGGVGAYFFYAITSLGHQAVIVFFVLSGFFVGGSFLNDNDFLKYSLKRLSRFYVVLIPALLLTLIFDLIGINIVKNINLYAGEGDNYIINFNAIDRLSLEIFISNMFYLQDIFYPTFGTNGALWSLAYEFWFYFLFPLLCYTLYQKNKIKFFLCGLLILLFLYALGLKGVTYFLIWMLGVICYLLTQKYDLIWFFCKKSMFVFSNIIFLVILLLSIFYKGYIVDLVLGFVFSLYLVNVVSGNIKLYSYMNKLSFNLAKLSFSMYAIHLPILVLLCAVIDKKMKLDFFGLFVYFLIMLFVVFCSWFFWFFFEKKNIYVYNLIYSLFRKNKNG